MRTENPIRTQPTHTVSYIWRSVIRAHDIMLRTPCNLLVYHADLWRMCGFPYLYRNVDANFKKGQSRQTIQKRLPGEVTSQGNFPSRTSKRESFGRSGYQLMYNFRWVFSFALSEVILFLSRVRCLELSRKEYFNMLMTNFDNLHWQSYSTCINNRHTLGDNF